MFEIKFGNIFDGKADACLIQCDGGSRKSVGKMGLQMEKRLGEDIWSDIMDQFSWPVALGDAQFQWIDDEVVNENFKALVLMSSMSHLLERTDHATLLSTSLGRALTLTAEKGCSTVSMLLGRGGHRLRFPEAIALIENAVRLQPRLHVTAYTLNTQVIAEINNQI